jgi:hypothetical protein
MRSDNLIWLLNARPSQISESFRLPRNDGDVGLRLVMGRTDSFPKMDRARSRRHLGAVLRYLTTRCLRPFDRKAGVQHPALSTQRSRRSPANTAGNCLRLLTGQERKLICRVTVPETCRPRAHRASSRRRLQFVAISTSVQGAPKTPAGNSAPTSTAADTLNTSLIDEHESSAYDIAVEAVYGITCMQRLACVGLQADE